MLLWIKGIEEILKAGFTKLPYKCSELYMVLIECGVVWNGVLWCCGVVWCGVVWCSVVWNGVLWCCVVWFGVVWCGVV